jgi:hypothetical protein
MVLPSSDGGGASRARFTGDVSAVGSRIQFMFGSFKSFDAEDAEGNYTEIHTQINV